MAFWFFQAIAPRGTWAWGPGANPQGRVAACGSRAEALQVLEEAKSAGRCNGHFGRLGCRLRFVFSFPQVVGLLFGRFMFPELLATGLWLGSLLEPKERLGRSRTHLKHELGLWEGGKLPGNIEPGSPLV